MTVGKLITILQKEDPNEEIYVWDGNWPTEHYTTNIRVGRPYGSVQDDKRNLIDSPLIIR